MLELALPQRQGPRFDNFLAGHDCISEASLVLFEQILGNLDNVISLSFHLFNDARFEGQAVGTEEVEEIWEVVNGKP